MPSDQLEQADITWDADRQPISSRHDDVYFSRDSGIAESEYVFLSQNHLPQRWRELSQQTSGIFTIAETGFGTGLNFLAATQLWLKTAPAGWQLHYISAEKYPLTRGDLQKALNLWPQLKTLATELEYNYPPLLPGTHRVTLFGDRVELTLLFGEASEGFEQIRNTDHPRYQYSANPVVDAWFLDGFAPAKNPDMWTHKLFQVVADLSNVGTTIATFTAAGIVKRGLSAVGFDIEKVAGFGHKRDMIRGVMTKSVMPESMTEVSPSTTRNAIYSAPWYLDNNNLGALPKTAVIIGGGIAGCCAANALARRGWQITLLERHNHLAAEASGNPQGIIYPKFSVQDSSLSRYGLYGLMYASRFYRKFWQDGKHGEQCGVLVLPASEKQVEDFAVIAQRFAAAPELVRLCTQDEMALLSGLPLNTATGLFCPGLGWVIPPAVCHTLATGPEIQVIQGDAHQLIYTDQSWQVLDGNGRSLATTRVVIVASGIHTTRFEQLAHLPIKPIRGQITVVPQPRQTGNNTLRTVVCGSGYIAPAHDGNFTLGASYNIGDNCVDVRPGDNRANLEKLRNTDRALGSILPDNGDQLSGRTGFRCTTPDYLPIVGPAPDMAAMQQRFAPLRKNARADIPLPGSYYPGLYVSCGYGSRGLSYSPLAAELLAAQICGEPAPMERQLATALNPARFFIRAIKRNEI